MLPQSAIERIIPILKKDCRRALRMRVPGFPSPYFCSLLLRDTEWFNTWAGSGSTYRKRSDKTRNVYCDLRVGSYRYDQITDGGLKDNDEERDSVSYLKVPIDDRHYEGLRMALWRLLEFKFREALGDYSDREAKRISTLDPFRKLASFSKGRRSICLTSAKPERVDEEYWTKFCKNASKWLSELPHVSSSWVEFDASQQTKILVNTEGSVIVQHPRIFSLSANLYKITEEGSTIEQELVINTATMADLPSMSEFRRLIRHKHEQLLKLIKAKNIHSFSGPILLCPGPAGLLFHEAIGHRLEGSRLLSSGEGQTFKGQIGKRILNIPISIRDNPRLKKFKGVKCVGAYDYDDEGTLAHNTPLVREGMLEGFLTTRAALLKKDFKPSGHARNKKFERPISRMAVTIVEGKHTVPFAKLKELLIKEIKKQKKPFGMIVYETSGGETETTNYDFQAFAGEISFATLIYPDGREECVRGVNFVGTPLQALNNIIAVGDTQELDNGYCGAESGFIPVSTIAPAVLLSNLELQAKEEHLIAPYVLPRPRPLRYK